MTNSGASPVSIDSKDERTSTREEGLNWEKSADVMLIVADQQGGQGELPAEQPGHQQSGEH